MRYINVLIVGFTLICCVNQSVPIQVPPTETSQPIVISGVTSPRTLDTHLVNLTMTPIRASPTEISQSTDFSTVTSPSFAGTPLANPTMTPIPEMVLKTTYTPMTIISPITHSPTPVFVSRPVILPTIVVTGRMSTPTPTSQQIFSRKLDAIGFRTSLIRDLSGRGPVERELITKEELKSILINDLYKRREDIIILEKLYQILSITHEQTDLFELLATMLTDVHSGFFDIVANKLYLVANIDTFGPRDSLTVSHEFVHGLQQLHFDVTGIRESIEGNADMNRAFTALTEGDAILSEMLYLSEYLDEKEQSIVRKVEADSDISGLLAGPRTIQRLITFPYTDGLPFIIDLFSRASNFTLINDAYQHLPLSTEQIIHKDKYYAKEAPTDVLLPNRVDNLGLGWVEITRNTFGELFLRSYLESGLSWAVARATASGWGGDRYVLFENESNERLLISVTEWDSERDATEFYLMYQQLLESMGGGYWEDVAGKNFTVNITQPRGNALVQLDGRNVLIILSPDLDTTLAVVNGITHPVVE